MDQYEMGQDRASGLQEKHSTDRPGDRAHETDGSGKYWPGRIRSIGGRRSRPVR